VKSRQARRRKVSSSVKGGREAVLSIAPVRIRSTRRATSRASGRVVSASAARREEERLCPSRPRARMQPRRIVRGTIMSLIPPRRRVRKLRRVEHGRKLTLRLRDGCRNFNQKARFLTCEGWERRRRKHRPKQDPARVEASAPAAHCGGAPKKDLLST